MTIFLILMLSGLRFGREDSASSSVSNKSLKSRLEIFGQCRVGLDL